MCGEVVGLDCGEVTNSTRFALGVIHDWAWVGMMYLRDLSQFHIVPLLLLPDIQTIFTVDHEFKPLES